MPTDPGSAPISVVVAYAAPQGQFLTSLRLAPGTTVREAVLQSGLLAASPHVSLDALGVFGHRVSGDALVKDGDRIEVYRPLRADPKEARRQRVRHT